MLALWQPTVHRGQLRVVTSPNVLFVEPGREADAGPDRVVAYPVQPERDFTLPGLGDRYELAGVVYRRGVRTTAAKYHCVVKCNDGRWWRFEDGCVTRVFRRDLERSELRAVHLMMYTRPRAQVRFAGMGPLVAVSVAAPAVVAPCGAQVVVSGQRSVDSAAHDALGVELTLLKRRRPAVSRVGARK